MAKEKNTMYFDFETTTGAISTERSDVYIWGGMNEYYDFHWDISMDSFIDYLSDNEVDEAIFHNLSWDGNFIFKWLLENGWGFSDERRISKNDEKVFNWICDGSGNIYQIIAIINGHKVKFKCSYKQLMSSVTAMGKALGLGEDKLDLDYDKYSQYNSRLELQMKSPELIEYLERDIKIVVDAHAKMMDIYEEKMTAASTAYNDFKKDYGERQFALDFGGKVWNWAIKKMEYKTPLTPEAWNIGNKSYQGGYVAWAKGIEDKAVMHEYGVSYDVNSLFPAVQELNKMPYGAMLKYKPKGDSAELVHILIRSAKIKNKKYPALIKARTGRYGDPKYQDEVEYDERVYWREELEFIKKYYDMDYIVYNRYWFRTKFIFKKWIGSKKWLKINAKTKYERNQHKLIQNSNYGKFAQNPKVESRVLFQDGKIPWQPYIENLTEYEEMTATGQFGGYLYMGVKKTFFNWEGKVYEKGHPDSPQMRRKGQVAYGKDKEWVHKKVVHENDKYNYIIVASYTTFKARMVLWKAMFDNLDIWLYSDTDSCYFSEEPKGLWIHDSDYGAWKPEHKFNKFKVLRAKCYMFDATHEYGKDKDGIIKWIPTNKIVKKISGVSKEGKKKINWDNFKAGQTIKGAKRGKINVDGGYIIVDKDYSLGREH